MTYSKKPKKKPSGKEGTSVGKITRKEKMLGILAVIGLFLVAVLLLLLYLYLQLS